MSTKGMQPRKRRWRVRTTRRGPEASTPRLRELDPEALGSAFARLVWCAQDKSYGGRPPDVARVFSQIAVVRRAFRARDCLCSHASVRIDDLAALASVSVTRVQQLAERGVLRRTRRGFVDCDSALAWISGYYLEPEEMDAIMADLGEEVRESMR